MEIIFKKKKRENCNAHQSLYIIFEIAFKMDFQQIVVYEEHLMYWLIIYRCKLFINLRYFLAIPEDATGQMHLYYSNSKDSGTDKVCLSCPSRPGPKAELHKTHGAGGADAEQAHKKKKEDDSKYSFYFFLCLFKMLQKKISNYNTCIMVHKEIM